jgi:hypothetical protein
MTPRCRRPDDSQSRQGQRKRQKARNLLVSVHGWFAEGWDA